VVIVWSAEQVLALAPDAGGAAAGRKLGSPAPWSGTGQAEADGAVWGLCEGSGRSPYRTVVDLGGPAYKCSCPSRKFPCKHALGLLLLWSDGQVGPAEAPEWVHAWLQTRVAKAAAPAAPRSPDADAARGRADRRADRVAGGIDELDRWLADNVRTGLATVPGGGYRHFESVAARMVDAQAPGWPARCAACPGSPPGPRAGRATCWRSWRCCG